MIDGSEKRNRQLAFELQNSHVCEKRSKGKTFTIKFEIWIKPTCLGHLLSKTPSRSHRPLS